MTTIILLLLCPAIGLFCLLPWSILASKTWKVKDDDEAESRAWLVVATTIATVGVVYGLLIFILY